MAPAVAASLQDVTVTKPGTASITDGKLSFSICAVCADIGSGSTFTVSGVTGATVDSGFTLSGSTITLQNAIVAGDCRTLTLTVPDTTSGNVGVAVGTVSGNLNQQTGNDSAAYTCTLDGSTNAQTCV